MSGASFDYLYAKTPEPPADLAEMAQAAEKAGNVKGAWALKEIVDGYFKLAEQWENAAEFMRAFEWMCSGDYTPDQVAETEAAL